MWQYCVGVYACEMFCVHITQELLFTKAELEKYSSENKDKLFLSVLGQVFDVTKGRRFYGMLSIALFDIFVACLLLTVVGREVCTTSTTSTPFHDIRVYRVHR